MSLKYGKTPTLFIRSEETFKVIVGNFASPYHRQIKDFLVTEKIDGINGHVILDWAYDDEAGKYRPVVDIHGRSDNANLPPNLLQEAFGVEEEHELTDRLFRALQVLDHGGETVDELIEKILIDPVMVVLHGEFYGAGIQKGGMYSPTKQFRAFDLVTYRYETEPLLRVPNLSRPLWRQWDELCDFCEVAGLKTVPLLAYDATIDECVERIRDVRSAVAAAESGKEYARASDLPHAEGIVARTDPYLFDWRGERIFFKLKGKDFA